MDPNVSVGCLIKIISFTDRRGNYQIIDYFILSPEDTLGKNTDSSLANQQRIIENEETSRNYEKPIQKGPSMEIPDPEEKSIMQKKAEEIVKRRMNALQNHMKSLKP
jgi:hypothetical protein